MPMDRIETITHSRGSFALLRGAPVVAAAVLPFTFARGPAPLSLLLAAVPIAALWLGCLLMGWRTQKYRWFLLAWMSVMLGSRVAGYDHRRIFITQAVQWLCLVLILAGAPLLLWRDRLLKFARLNEANDASTQPD